MEQSKAFACQDGANANPAHRFMSNDSVNEADIVAGHFLSTRERVGATQGRILVPHDISELL